MSSMEEAFKIFIDRLQDGEEEKIEEKFSPEFLSVHEVELLFLKPVFVKGLASKSKGSLILQFNIQTEATMPCAICNENVQVKIAIAKFYHVEDLDNIKSGIFNFKELIREAILIEVPYKTECHEGSCPERENLAKYLRK